MLGGAQCKPYHAYPAIESPEFIPGFDKIEEPSGCNFEWCEPVWLHLNQVITSTDETIAKKLKGAGDLLGMQLPNYDPSVVLDGPLPTFMPRLVFPQTPKEFGRFGGGPPLPVWAPGEWQANQYRGAIRLWSSRGKPFRSDEAADMIYDSLCTPCPYYEDGACQACGCGITGAEEELRLIVPDFDDNHPLRNKIKLATEHCPQWKW
jgi:hypothetical protein